MSVIDELDGNNEAYAESFGDGELEMPPAKPVVVLTCIDARLDPAAMLGLASGDAHVVRNAGGLATDDALRSITISQHLQGTTDVMLIHHTNCGMAMFSEDAVAVQIEDATGSRPPFPLGFFPNIDDSVRANVAIVRASGFLKNEGQVRGFVYDVGSGRLREVPA